MTRDETITDASPMYRGVIKNALDGTASPRAAIKAFCLRCVGYIRADVQSCTSLNCPLHKYRPYQTPEDTDSPAEAVAEGSQNAPVGGVGVGS